MFRPQLLASTARVLPRASVARASLPSPAAAARAFSFSPRDLAAPRKKRTKKAAAPAQDSPKKAASSAPKKQAAKDDKLGPSKNQASSSDAKEPEVQKAEAKKPGPSKRAAPKAVESAPEPKHETPLPPADAPTDKKASTLSSASQAHKDLAIDPDVVVASNTTAPSTARQAAVEGHSFQPRHAGENPPGVPPQALKKAPETFNIQIPWPRRQAAAINPVIPVLHSAADVQPEGTKPPPAVHAVADEERVHSPIASALSAAEEKELEKKYANPNLAILHQVGVPPAVLDHTVVLFDKASKNFYSLLPDGFAIAVDPIKADGKTEFRFHPGALPRQFNPEERRGLMVLTALLMVCLSASILMDMITLGQAQSAAVRNSRKWEKEHPGETPAAPFAAPK